MTWWGWLIVVVAVVISTATIVLVFFRSSKLVKIARKEIDVVKQQAAIAHSESNKEVLKDLQKARDNLNLQLARVKQWYNAAEKQIEKERKNQYENLSNDPNALDDKLNDIISGAKEDKSKKGSKSTV